MEASHTPLTLDVRPLLAQGIEPFGAIVEAKNQLKPEQTFVLQVPFEPLPLYGLFQSDGFQVEAKKHAENDWEIHFIPHPGASATERELDLRLLEPPIPLHKSLEALHALSRGERLTLHTRFRPVHLFEQVDTETTDYDCEELGPNHWVTTFWRISS